MDEQHIETIEDIAAFLNGTIDTPLALHGNKDDVYSWWKTRWLSSAIHFITRRKKALSYDT